MKLFQFKSFLAQIEQNYGDFRVEFTQSISGFSEWGMDIFSNIFETEITEVIDDKKFILFSGRDVDDFEELLPEEANNLELITVSKLLGRVDSLIKAGFGDYEVGFIQYIVWDYTTTYKIKSSIIEVNDIGHSDKVVCLGGDEIEGYSEFTLGKTYDD